MSRDGHLSALDRRISKFLIGEDRDCPKAEHGILLRELGKVNRDSLCSDMLQKGSRNFRKKTDSAHESPASYIEIAQHSIFSNAIRILPLSYWTCELWLKFGPQSALEFPVVPIVYSPEIRQIFEKCGSVDFKSILAKSSLFTRTENTGIKNALIKIFLKIIHYLRMESHDHALKICDGAFVAVQSMPVELQENAARVLGFISDSGDVSKWLTPQLELALAERLDGYWAWKLHQVMRSRFAGKSAIHFSDLKDIVGANPALLVRLASIITKSPFSTVLVGDSQLVCAKGYSDASVCLDEIRSCRAGVTAELRIDEFLHILRTRNRNVDCDLAKELILNDPNLFDEKTRTVAPDLGSGVREYILRILRGGGSSMHFDEIFKTIEREGRTRKWLIAPTSRNLYALLNADPDIFKLGRNSYGTADQLRASSAFSHEIIENCVDVMLASPKAFDRQWSTEDLLANLPKSADYFASIDAFKLVYILRSSPDLVYWGRHLFSLRGIDVGADRATVKELIFSIISASGGKIPKDKLLEQARNKRSLSVMTFVSALNAPELFVDENDCVGICDRDLIGSNVQRKDACDIILTWAEVKGDTDISDMLLIIQDALFPEASIQEVRELVRCIVKMSGQLRLRRSAGEERLLFK